MKRTAIVVAAVVALAVTPALAAKGTKGKAAKGPACTSESMAKTTGSLNTMPDTPAKMAASKEIAGVNTEMSKGNMRGACAHHARAQMMTGAK